MQSLAVILSGRDLSKLSGSTRHGAFSWGVLIPCGKEKSSGVTEGLKAPEKYYRPQSLHEMCLPSGQGVRAVLKAPSASVDSEKSR